MTDSSAKMNSQKKSQTTNVLTYVGKGRVPHYELNGEEIIFPIPIQQRGVRKLIHVVMDAQAPYSSVAAILGEAMPVSVRSEMGGLESVAGNDEKCQEFTRKHFRRIIGVGGNPSIEDQRRYVERNPDLQSRIYNEGYGAILNDCDDAEPEELVIDFDTSNEVRVRRVLYCPETEQTVTVRYIHQFGQISHSNRRIFQKAIKTHQEGRESRVIINWDVLRVQLYQPLIQSIEGFLVNSKPCTVKNRSDWLEKVPVSDQIGAVLQLFGRNSEKNVA